MNSMESSSDRRSYRERRRHHSSHSDSEDERDRKKHKKSKKSSKDKHKDKGRDRDHDRHGEKDKYKNAKPVPEPELTALEKFNMFKKQREAVKSEEGQVVDDLFKDFIAQKIQQIESENYSKEKKTKSKKDGKVSDSVNELNKFLDAEISNIGKSGDVSEKSKVKPDKDRSTSVLDVKEKAAKCDAERGSRRSSPLQKSTTLGGLLKIDKSKETKKLESVKSSDKSKDQGTGKPVSSSDKPNIRSTESVQENISQPHVINVIPQLPKCVQANKSVIENGKSQAVVGSTNNTAVITETVSSSKEQEVKVDNAKTEKKTVNTDGELTSTTAIIGPMLPRSLALGDKNATSTTEEGSAVVKKPALGFKNFGIKLSAVSAEFIQSGEIIKKGKRLEDGEVLSSSSEEESSSDTDDDDDDGELSESGSLGGTDHDGQPVSRSHKKKKKKKKGKHKKKKKSKDKSRDKVEDVLVVKDKLASKRKVSVTPRSRSRSPKKRKSSRSKSRERSRRRSRSRSKGRSRSRRSRSRDKHSKSRRSRSRGRRSRSRNRRSHSRGRRSRSRDKRSRSKGRTHRSRSHSKSPDRFWRSKYGDFDAFKFLKGKHGRSGSRSPETERERFIDKERRRMEDLRVKIDKAKLREIAIQNALTNAKTFGTKLDVTIKAGGKSVEELTEYCKKIQERETERRKYRYDSSSDEEPSRAGGDDEDMHHPFQVKEAGSIIMDIPNSKQIPTATPQERLMNNSQLRLQFPVSSGSQHREKEWVPVEPEPTPPPTHANALVKIGAKPVAQPSLGGVGNSNASSTTLSGLAAIMPPPPAPPKPEVKVFDEPPSAAVDISAIVSERLTAMKKLQENPQDMSAKLVLDQAQKQASQWAASKNLPGKFLGSTGAQILSQEELMGDRKRQAWLKKDVFTNAAPVTGGIGMFLLQKMGWKYGEGLGKNNEGQREPLMLDFKVDRKGLVTTGEGKKSAPKAPVVKDLSGKHPVSALGELCNKRRWGAPQYEMIHESGPSHKKDFLFKVIVNNTEYQPSITSNNKKLAKAQAATICLQELGLVPRGELTKA